MPEVPCSQYWGGLLAVALPWQLDSKDMAGVAMGTGC